MASKYLPAVRFALAAGLAWAGAASCGAHDPAAPSGTEALREFLEGDAPIPDDEAELDALRELFATQAVRARGYVASGVSEAGDDGWSPVVWSRGGAVEPADVSPWIAAEDIDTAGRFAPRSDLCARGAPEAWEAGPFPTAGLSDQEEALEGLQERIGALSCALSRVAGREVAIAWTAPSAAGVVLSESDAPAAANARILHLISAAGGALPEAIVAEQAPDPSPPLQQPFSAPGSEAEPGVRAPGDPQNHPRPKPDDSSSGSDSGVCNSVCDGSVCDLDNIFGCASGSSSRSKSGSCGKCSDSPYDGDARAAAISLLFLSALLLRRRRSRAIGGALLIVLGLLASYPALAQAPDWRKHEQVGLEHLKGGRYEQAIAELEAAQALQPTADRLEKIALAQKELRRYPAAIATLERLLEQFGPALPAAGKKRVQAEIDALRGALVPLQIRVEPPEAQVSVDGEALPAGATAQPVPVAPGAHTITARLDGYEQAVQAVDVQAGSAGATATLKLVPNKAYLAVRAPHPGLIIALDGAPVGTGTWSGLVTPGRHMVQIYAPGSAAQTFYVDAVPGRSLEVPPPGPPAPLGPPPGPPPAPEPEPPPEPPPPRPTFRGFYGVGVATVLYQTTSPYGFDHDSPAAPGFALGARLGYRLGSPTGLELLIEYGRIANDGRVIQEYDDDRDGDGLVGDNEVYTDQSPGDYILQSIRFGPVFRLMIGDEVDRFVGGGGAGALYEFIDLDHADIGWNDATSSYDKRGTFHHDYDGWAPYGLLEVGYERSVGALLLGASLQLTLEAVSTLPEEPYGAAVQARMGLSLRMGYGGWRKITVGGTARSPAEAPNVQ